MINVAKNGDKNTPTLKLRSLPLTSLLTLLKPRKVQIFLKLEFKLFLTTIVSPIHT
jgi:hypothetical protein